MRIRMLATALLVAGASHVGAPARGLPFTGTLVVQVADLGVVLLPGSGSGDPTLPSIGASSFLGTASVPVPGAPNTQPVTQLFLSVGGNASGAVGSGPSFRGVLELRQFGIGVPVPVPLTGNLGFAGATTVNHSAASARISAQFGSWTTGVATVSRTHTYFSGACAPNFDCPTAMLGGPTANGAFFGGSAQIVLVAPVDVFSTLYDGLPTFAVMGLNYVPEPGRLLLLGSGVLTLTIAGRVRGRGRSSIRGPG